MGRGSKLLDNMQERGTQYFDGRGIMANDLIFARRLDFKESLFYLREAKL